MAINASEKKALQTMWDNAKAPGSVDLPDGKYEFVIVKAKPVIGKATAIKQVLEVTGGHSDYIGEHVDLWDRLESEDNMGWFKKKAAILGITIPKDIELVFGESDVDGSICQQLLGKKFEGAVVTKKDFLNIYCNRFIEDVDLDELTNGDDAEDDADQHKPGNGANGKHDPEPEPNGKDEKPEEIEEDDAVTFLLKGKKIEGTVVELVEDGTKARVKTDKGTYKLACDKLEIVYDDSPEPEPEPDVEPEPEPEPEPEDEPGNKSFPTPEEISELRMPAIRKALKAANLDPDDIAKVRELAMAVAGFMHEENYKPEVTQLKQLCKTFAIKSKKGIKPGALVKLIGKAVQKHFD